MKHLIPLFPEFNFSDSKVIHVVRKQAVVENSLKYTALFYVLEALSFEYDAIAELKGILDESFGEDKVLLLILLSLESKRVSREEISKQVDKKLKQMDLNNLPPAYIEYIDSLNIAPKAQVLLKGKEKHLYDTLSESSKAKIDLVILLYGEEDVIKGEAKFKALLSRLRKKIDEQIIMNSDGLYELVG
ncbi:MAG: hypothetical protein CME64_14640 [Halobacteriovoraceae bacterium]|nr:hypothetical protein [Halobacteriovoraceae bacterium]